MKRGLLMLLAFSIYCSPHGMAQHGGHNGGSSNGRQTGSPGTTVDSDATGDFKHAIAVQATPEQAAQFRLMLQAGEAAIAATRNAEQKFAAGMANPDSTVLESAIKQARQSNALFLDSLSNSQTSGMKKLIKNLRQADSGVGSSWEALAKQLQSPKAAPSKTEGAAQKLEKSLDRLRVEQANLGSEMGIQTPKSATSVLGKVSIHLEG